MSQRPVLAWSYAKNNPPEQNQEMEEALYLKETDTLRRTRIEQQDKKEDQHDQIEVKKTEEYTNLKRDSTKNVMGLASLARQAQKQIENNLIQGKADEEEEIQTGYVFHFHDQT